jgi:hypothetical protein
VLKKLLKNRAQELELLEEYIISVLTSLLQEPEKLTTENTSFNEFK